MRLFFSLTCSLLAITPFLAAQTVQHGLRVPDGFQVTEFSTSGLANDIFSMTLDPRGRVVVSGRGYIKILVDDDGDGKADRAIDFSSAPAEGAQGLLWEGNTLFFTGDGGLRRYRARADNSRADGPSELIRAMRTGDEHAAHAIRRGPDGWLYVLCGNTAGIDRRYATGPGSPIRDPIAGCVLRLSPDEKTSEIVADGFRNPYDMDFTLDGDLITFDSDNERCVSLPWYESTRLYHVIPGGHYGWQAPGRAQFWRMPPYFPDVIAPIAHMGRGSPTGVTCYRHTQFPTHYRGGLFLLDWTFGRVYFVSLQRSGSSYTCNKEVFLKAVGDNGFAPTAAAVHPATGDLYIAIGGRGTRGAVYRIRHRDGFRSLSSHALGAVSVEEASRLFGRHVPAAARSLDMPREEFLEQARHGNSNQRLRALGAMRHERSRFSPTDVQDVVAANLDHADRYVRLAAANLLADLPRGDQQFLVKEARSPKALTTLALGTYSSNTGLTLKRARCLIAASVLPMDLRLANVRVVQLALGDLMAPAARGTVWEGYTLRKRVSPDDVTTNVMAELESLFPTGHADLDREISRTLAALEDDRPALLTKVLGKLTPSSDPVEDIHYLIVAARLRATRSETMTSQVATALLDLDRKIIERHLNRDRNWAPRVAEIHAELARHDPRLNTTMINDPRFGRPDHVLFTQCPGFDRSRAAEVFLRQISRTADYPWTDALVDLIGCLPAATSAPVLRRAWGKAGMDEAILPVLARQLQPEDRSKFEDGLNSSRPATLLLCITALEKLPPDKNPDHLLALVRALRRLPPEHSGDSLRARLCRYLATLTGQSSLANTKEAWTHWLTGNYPELAARLSGSDGVDAPGWTRRLARVNWLLGDSTRGLAVYTRASCAACHSGSQALGPDLHGVAGRFSRADLFTAIVQPSKDISPRYRTTLITTADDKVYQGMVVYEAVDSLILQTGPATTVRVVHDQIAGRRFTDLSLMPAGLLDKLSDQDIADLYAYLKNMGAPSRK